MSINIYRCELELHDSLYFATRELGRLYETEPVLHNYALSYALGFVDSETYSTTVSENHSYRYFCGEQVPQYEEHLTPLNERGIYVTPARPISYSSVLNTWKYADNRYHVEMQKTQKNIPSFGRAKEIAPESIFEFFIISKNQIPIPRWVRLGKWASKGEVRSHKLPDPKPKNGRFTVSHPLNPLDVMFSHQVIRYDVINMPPVSLIQNAQIQGSYYQADHPVHPTIKIKIPAEMGYRFRAN